MGAEVNRNEIALQLLLRIIPNYLEGPMNSDDMKSAVDSAFELADLFLKECEFLKKCEDEL